MKQCSGCKELPKLIVMLTHNDITVENAFEIFEQCKNTKVEYWGMKEEGLPLEKMKEVYAYMKKSGKRTGLEVVAYTEKECMAGAKKAVECGCDFLLGTKFFDSVNEFCKEHNLKYMPFVGKVSERPSVLEGEIEDMIRETKEYLKKGVYGIDLLVYRYKGSQGLLVRRMLEEIDAPICVAGSIDSYEKLDEMKQLEPWAVTIGSAFFEHKFGDTFFEQIDKIFGYWEQKYV